LKAPRIVHVIHSSAFGGGPNMLTLLCTQLRDEFEMDVICDGQGDMPARLEKIGIAVRRLPLTTKWSFTSQIPRLASAIRSRRPDLVHLHGQFAGSLGQLALQLAGTPRSVYTALWPSFLDDDGPWSRFRNHISERVSCTGAAAVVAASEYDRRELVARGLCDENKLSVIYCAYFLEDGVVPAPPPPASQVVGFVGRLVDQKGCEYLVRAAPRVVAAHRNARFVIVGEGPELKRLQSIARELGVASAVEFAGYDPAPARRMRSMTILAVPSLYESLGMVALEAMACGVAVVASAVGGLTEAVDDGRTGLLVPPRNPDALATALVRLLDAPDIASQMGSAGRQLALRKFSPEVIANQYAKLYRRLIAATSS